MISSYGPLSHVDSDDIFDELLYRFGNTQTLFIAVKADGTATLRNMHNGDGVPPVTVLRKMADELEAQGSN